MIRAADDGENERRRGRWIREAALVNGRVLAREQGGTNACRSQRDQGGTAAKPGSGVLAGAAALISLPGCKIGLTGRLVQLGSEWPTALKGSQFSDYYQMAGINRRNDAMAQTDTTQR